MSREAAIVEGAMGISRLDVGMPSAERLSSRALGEAQRQLVARLGRLHPEATAQAPPPARAATQTAELHYTKGLFSLQRIES